MNVAEKKWAKRILLCASERILSAAEAGQQSPTRYFRGCGRFTGLAPQHDDMTVANRELRCRAGLLRRGRRPVKPEIFASQNLSRENNLPGVLLEVSDYLINRL